MNLVQLGDDHSNGPGPSHEKTFQAATKSVAFEAILTRKTFVEEFVLDELKVP